MQNVVRNSKKIFIMVDIGGNRDSESKSTDPLEKLDL